MTKNLLFSDLPFDSEHFKIAWMDWEQHRKLMKEPLTEVSRKRQLRFLASLGEEQAIQSIDNSINYNWTGLFEPKPVKWQLEPKVYPIAQWNGKKYGE